MKEVAPVFKWKPNGDQPMIAVTDMDTRHLFNTLRMIWNHCAPEDLKFTPYRAYNFGRFYTAEYMAEAVRAMLRELMTRKVLTGEILFGIEHMAIAIATDSRVFGRIEHGK